MEGGGANGVKGGGGGHGWWRERRRSGRGDTHTERERERERERKKGRTDKITDRSATSIQVAGHVLTDQSGNRTLPEQSAFI